MKTLLIWIVMALAAAAECVSVTGDKIVARDLARAIPEFGSVPGDEVLSFAPIPGLTRTLKASQITMLAKRFQSVLNEGAVKDVCFVSAAEMLTEDQIRAAILPAIEWSVVSLKVVDFSRSPLPPGRLEFRATGLSQSSLNAAGTTLWHGRLVTDSGRSFPVWVKLWIVVAAKIVVSTREIAKNQLLTSGDVAYSSEVPFPLPEGALRSVEEATSRTALRHIAKASPVLKWMLEQPAEVRQGQVVHVDAICGDARLSFDARAQTTGHRGDLIRLLNPNGRTFQARVIDKGRVEVRTSAGD